MKWIIETDEDGVVNKVLSEYTPSEYIMISNVLKMFACDESIPIDDRTLAQEMLNVEPRVIRK